MSKLIIEMAKPEVCITKDGYYGNCPMDRVWCVQRNAPSGTKMGDAYAEMTDNIPSWCPIKGVLPDEHGDLIDRSALIKSVNGVSTHWLNDWSTLGVLSMIDKQPTVIAAERKEHGTTVD